MIVAFTGGRDYRNEDMVRFVTRFLEEMSEIADWRIDEWRVGDCPTGLDKIVRCFIQEAEVFKADWKRYGNKSAGPIRNREMLTVRFGVDILVAFPGGKGTADCVRQARELGIRVLEVPQ